MPDSTTVFGDRERKTARTLLKWPPGLKERVKQVCAHRGLSINALVLQYIERVLSGDTPKAAVPIRARSLGRDIPPSDADVGFVAARERWTAQVSMLLPPAIKRQLVEYAARRWVSVNSLVLFCVESGLLTDGESARPGASSRDAA
jgi:predicted HicB family RNase H-like nuclease